MHWNIFVIDFSPLDPPFLSRLSSLLLFSVPVKTPPSSCLLLETWRFTCTTPSRLWAGSPCPWTMTQGRWSTRCSINSKRHFCWHSYWELGLGGCYGTWGQLPVLASWQDCMQIHGKQIVLLYFLHLQGQRFHNTPCIWRLKGHWPSENSAV